MDIHQISTSFAPNVSEGMSISGVSLKDIIASYPTPFFVYDQETIRRKYQYLRTHLPERVHICFAMKANPALAIVKTLTDMGSGVEIASRGELLVCKQLGIAPEKIAFGGPVKSDQEITDAITMGIYSVHAESAGEIKRIQRIAEKLGKNIHVSLRINPSFYIDGAVGNMGGGSQKFGTDVEDMEDVVKLALQCPNITLQGLHIFSATGILNQEHFLANMKNCFEIAKEMNSFFPVTEIDIGGGLGIPYKDDEHELAIDDIGQTLGNLLEDYSFIKTNNTTIILEPGRYLVGQSGIYVTTVVDRKTSRGKDYLMVDGGIHHLLRPPLVKQNHPTFNVSKLNVTGETHSFTVAGPLCTSLDAIARDVLLPADSAVGDVLGVFCSGAYGYTESMPFFLSHPLPPELMVHDGTFSLIRPGITVESLLAQQIIPDFRKA